MRKILGLLFNRWVLGVLGLAAIGLLVWYVGPLVSIAGYAPLEPVLVRQVLIALIVLAFVLRIAVKLVKAARANDQLMRGLLGGGDRAPKAVAEPTAGAAEVALLNERFEGAVKRLKTARFGAGRSILARLSKQYVYELPWYLIIGAPGSGKTTALLNAGLTFPLADELGQDPIRGVAGTRNCDWLFTDEAVLIDTAGRYTTQDSDHAADGEAWVGFLGLLKKFRPRRPINGVLLTISMAELLEQTPAEREAHAQKLRQRVQELHEHVGIRFPIYVLVTKTDLLAGFTEFFETYGKEERAQVWGTTFALPGIKGVKGAGAGASTGEADVLSRLPAELVALQQRLDDRLIDRLQGERDVNTRAAIYAFPQQWAAARETLREFVERVFAASRFAERPLVRGVYFTSGTQEGTPIDRVIGTMGRSLGLARRPLATNRPTGRSFFLTRLLREVIFAEAGLAGTNLKWERRRALVQWGAIAAAVIVSAVVVAAWVGSYAQNKAYVGTVEAKLAQVDKDVAGLKAAGSTDVVALVPVLRSVRDLATASSIPGEGPPFSMGLGLYQGDKLGIAADTAYRRLLKDALLSRIDRRVEDTLRAGGQQNPELLYEALKTYVMLHDVKRFNAAAVKLYVAADWTLSLPREVTTETRKELELHLDQLLAAEDLVSPLPADARLLAAARDAVARTPIAERVYNRLKRQDIGASFPEFTIARAGGPAAQLVIRRQSGQPLTRGVPGLFSYDGYHKAFTPAADRVSKQLAEEEPWVLGTGAATGVLASLAGGARDRVSEDVRRLYLDDYYRQWRAFIDDVRVVPGSGLDANIQAARILSSPTESPLPPLFRAVVREVTLATAQEGEKTIVDTAREKIEKSREEMTRLLGNKGVPVPARNTGSIEEQLVDTRFEDLRRMVKAPAPGQPTPLDGTIKLIDDLYNMLLGQQAALKNKTPPPPSEVPKRIAAEAGRMPDPVRSMMSTLASAGAAQVQQQTVAVVSDTVRSELADFCAKAVERRYPFVRSAGRELEVTQEDFGALFGQGGRFDEVFLKTLAPLVDTTSRPWRFKPGDAPTPIHSDALPQFQRAAVIRDVFFRGGGRVPQLRMEFRPVEMDATITQFMLDIDGQIIRYSHGPQVPQQVSWPGTASRRQVRLTIQPPPPSGTSGITFDGPWALFRLLDEMQVAPAGQPERFFVTFNVEGRKAQFEVSTSSVLNPFKLRELQEFRCPRGL